MFSFRQIVCYIIIHSPLTYAWNLVVTPGPPQIFIAVGNTVIPAGNNATINLVSVTVPAAQVGNGTAQAMTSNSTQANSPYDNYPVCNPPNQVYIGVSSRMPGSAGNTAILTVTTPANLINSSGDTIPFTQISWTSSANGSTSIDIPAGTFTGGTQTLVNVAVNRYLEMCFTFSFANTAVKASGTYTGRATYTLSRP